MKAIVTSDWHLDAVSNGVPRFEQLKARAWEAARRCVDEGCDTFLMLGDLCDPTPRSSRFVAVAVEIAEFLNDCDIVSHWIVGNHDVIEDGAGSHVMQPLKAAGAGNVHEEPGLFVHGGVALVALPYPHRSRPYDPILFLDQLAVNNVAVKEFPTVVCGHLSLPNITPGSETEEMGRGRDVMFDIDRAKKLLPNALFLNGHYHNGQVYSGIIIPGSLDRLSHGEERTHPSMLVIASGGS